MWDDKYQKVFEDIKQYLLIPFILVFMGFTKPSYLYISPTLYALGVMLYQRDDEGKEMTIYYLSKTLFDHETRMYTPMEKLYFGIIFDTKN